MGLWSFVKGSGKKLFGGGEEEAPKAEALQKEIADLGLDASGGNDELKEKIILAVGNVDGVAAVADNTAAGAAEPVFHTVEKGDTLWAIAEKTMGNGSKYQAIFEANKPMLSHPDKIYPGQMLRIPQ